MIKPAKLGIVTSKGGHLYQLLELKNVFKKYNTFWVSFKGYDTSYFLKGKKIYEAYYPESRNIVNAFKNLLLAIKILREERPMVILSCGAGIAIPFFIIGKFFGIKLIYIEPYDFVAYPSLTGRIVYNFVNLFLIQHKQQKKWFPKATYWGSLL